MNNVTEKVDSSKLFILRNQSHRKSGFPEISIRSKNSFVSVQIIAFAGVSTRSVRTYRIAIAIVSINQTFVDIFAFGSRKLQIQIHETRKTSAEKSAAVIGASGTGMAIMVTCSTFVDAYAKLLTDVGDRKLLMTKTHLIGEISQNVSKNLNSLQP